MPKKAMDYSKCLIYKLVSNDLDVKDCYVGHTCNFKQRKSHHKHDCNNENSNLKVYQFIRENGGWNNWSMVLVEYYPCNNELEARARERYWYEVLNASLNSQCPNRNQKEYRENNKEVIAENHKNWYENNKEKIAQQQKEYRENNKEVIAENHKNWYENNKEKVIEKVKEWNKVNKEKIVEYKKEWYETNKERVLEKMKEYRENNKEQIKEQKAQLITCECGRKITKDHKTRHCKSKFHLSYIQSISSNETVIL